MSKVAYFLSGWLVFASTPQALTLQEAAQAAQSVATPSYGEILTHEKRVEILPSDAIGNTSDLEKLKGNDGMGDILTPATNKTNACLKAGDPECLAIQVVKKNAQCRQIWTRVLPTRSTRAIKILLVMPTKLRKAEAILCHPKFTVKRLKRSFLADPKLKFVMKAQVQHRLPAPKGGK